MQVGIGIHGESGAERTRWCPAAEIVRTLLERILGLLEAEAGDQVIAWSTDSTALMHWS